MKIALDARGINWYTGTGIGTYTENLLKNLLTIDNENFYEFYWAGENYEEFLKENTKLVLVSNKNHFFFEEYFFPSDLKRNNIELYHIPQNGIGMNEDLPCRKIATIHDLIPYIMPETVGRGYLTKFLMEMPRIIENSDALITVSDYSKQDILKFFPINPDKIFVTPLAASSIYKPLDKEACRKFLYENYNITKPFLLYIGGFSPRKNVTTLINSFNKISNFLPKEYILVIVGSTKELDKNLIFSDNITFTNYVPENLLPIFYNACELFIYPSLYEGFGLPPLEAMSCATAVITTNVTSIPEVVGDSAILFNPLEEGALDMAILNTLADMKLLDSLRLMGPKRASQYSWKQTAKQTLMVYEEIEKATSKLI